MTHLAHMLTGSDFPEFQRGSFSQSYLEMSGIGPGTFSCKARCSVTQLQTFILGMWKSACLETADHSNIRAPLKAQVSLSQPDVPSLRLIWQIVYDVYTGLQPLLWQSCLTLSWSEVTADVGTGSSGRSLANALKPIGHSPRLEDRAVYAT